MLSPIYKLLVKVMYVLELTMKEIAVSKYMIFNVEPTCKEINEELSLPPIYPYCPKATTAKRATNMNYLLCYMVLKLLQLYMLTYFKCCGYSIERYIHIAVCYFHWLVKICSPLILFYHVLSLEIV
jgi:hypothetical protein